MNPNEYGTYIDGLRDGRADRVNEVAAILNVNGGVWSPDTLEAIAEWVIRNGGVLTEVEA